MILPSVPVLVCLHEQQVQRSAEHGALLAHQKRMAASQQRLFKILFRGSSTSEMRCSACAQANASTQQGVLLPREKHKAAYQAALVQRFRHLPEVKRIERHRHLPAALYKARRCPLGGVGIRYQGYWVPPVLWGM